MQLNKFHILSFILGLGTYHFAFKFFKKKKPIPTSVLQLVGNTPILKLNTLSKQCGSNIYVKCEWMNPCGSIKDRLASSIVKLAKYEKKSHIVEGTSGSTGISLSLLGYSLGLNTILCIPNDTSDDKKQLINAIKVCLIQTQPCSIVDKDHYARKAESIAKENNNYHYANQFETKANQQIHYETGNEIYEQLNGKIDVFIASAGTGGTISGISQFLKKKKSSIQIVIADPPGSSLLNYVNGKVCFTEEEKEGFRLKRPYDTNIEGVGLNRITANIRDSKIDLAIRVTDQEAYHMANWILQNEGIFIGPSSAMNLVAAVKLSKLNKNLEIVTIINDSGSRYLNKFYNLEQMKSKGFDIQCLESYIGVDLMNLL